MYQIHPLAENKTYFLVFTTPLVRWLVSRHSVADNGDSIVEQKFANSKNLDNNIIRFNGDSKVV